MIKKMLNGTTIIISDGTVRAKRDWLDFQFKTRESKIVYDDGLIILTDKDETGFIEIDEEIAHTLSMFHFVRIEGNKKVSKKK